jgi:pyrroline-5-carboxylate reductase
MQICFVGGGNMASALISGLSRKGSLRGSVTLCDPSEAARQRIAADFGIATFAELEPALAGAGLVVLAVKPQVMPSVLAELAAALARQASLAPVLVSVAAGVTTSTMQKALKQPLPLIRAMPNTPALLGIGISGLFAAEGCTAAHRDMAEQLMSSAGETVWLGEEAQLDVVTAVSGSGPAYFYLLIEALQKAAAGLGLAPETARLLALHTAHGAGVMALQADTGVAELRRRVTSPGGTTEAALRSLAESGFEAIVADAVAAASHRAGELSLAEPRT